MAAGILLAGLCFVIPFLMREPHQPLKKLGLAAVSNQGSKEALLRFGNGELALRVVVDPNGRGYAFDSVLPELDPSMTYQLWVADVPVPISIGVLGPRPVEVGFSAAAIGDATLVVTKERAGGSSVPSRKLASGSLRSQR